MKLSEKIKEEIKRESEEYLNEIKSGTDQYGGLTKEERDELGAFYTPPELCCQMLEMYDCTLEEFATKTILDPTCGSGNLIMAALIAGTMSGNKQYYKNVFGNELSSKPLELCRKRFVHWCKENLKNINEDWEEFWRIHLHQGNALNKGCISEESFTKDYVDGAYKEKERVVFGKELTEEEFKNLNPEERKSWIWVFGSSNPKKYKRKS